MMLPDFEPSLLSSTVAISIAALAWAYLYYREQIWGWMNKKRKG